MSHARVVELVDASDSKSDPERGAGSIPAPGTNGLGLYPAIGGTGMALPRKRGTGIHQTLLITPSQPHVAKTRSR